MSVSTSTVSVIVATCNRPVHLAVCLGGLAVQVDAGPFEVVVADDGSGPETSALLEEWKRRAAFPLSHVWEEHAGFRLARSRNRGVRAAGGEYLIFLDGDCVPPPGFLAAHRSARRPGSFVAGLRGFLDAAATGRLPRGSEGARAAGAALSAGERRRLALRSFLDHAYRLLHLKDRPKPLGANLGIWRADLEAANGFDERYRGWGFEDEDLGRRLARLGVAKRFAPAAARVVHLWHAPDPTFPGRAAHSPNAPRFREGLFLACCRRGLRERPLWELRARLRGLSGLAALLPLRPREGEQAELELAAPGHGPFDPRSEVRLAVVSNGSAAPPGAQRTLEVRQLDGPDALRGIMQELDDLL